MTDSIERARLKAFVARHPEADKPVPPPPPQGTDTVRARLRAVGKRALRIGSVGFWRVVRWVPPSVRSSPAAEPAKDALRWARRRWKRRVAPARIKKAPFVDGTPPLSEATSLRQTASQAHGRKARPKRSRTPKVALAILTRNGAHHIDNLLSSIEATWRYPNFEVWIVDHGSTDDTKQVVARYEQLDVRPIWLPDNHSFSASTNRIAKETDAPLLLMLNNDIIFSQDVLHRMVDELADPEVGVVGLRLFFPNSHADHPGGLQHSGIKFYSSSREPLVRPYNLSAYSGVGVHDAPAVEVVPAVTAACALVRREEFLAQGGLDEGYNYGFEDIALSLCYRERGQKCIVVNDVTAIHDESATQRTTARDGVRERRFGNQRLLRDQFGRRIQQAYLRDKMLARRFDSDEPLVVGFAVSEVGPDARAGDLFTAMELGAALEAEFGWRCRYLPRADGAWYDLRDVDVIVGLVNQYDPRSIHHARPHLLRVGWVRNWFDRWVENPGFATYDLVLSSSEAGARYILKHGHRDARVVPIASQPARFDRGTYAADLAADVVFTGSRWGEVRAIERNLQPEQIKGSVALFGAGWPEHPRLQPWARGFVPYERMADVYASAKIVVDDCIEQCRPWGSMNSRVFDALASGALVVTNCAIGSEELFDGRLPTYDSPAQLTELLNTFLADEGLRKRRVATLQASVRADHTYTERAHRFQSAVSSFLPEIPSRIEPGIKRRRISIKVPAPRQHAKAWGDYHFALAMQRHLQREGHTVRIDVLEDWSTPAGVFDDIVFVLRGLSRYEPSAHQATVMWNISHPDAVSDEEYESYDAVFVASLPYAEQLKARLKTPVAPLLQCTDPSLFYPDASGPHHEVLFVGNSRRRRRPVVMDAIQAGLPLSVYGQLWEQIITPRYLRSQHVPNDELRRYYSGAKVVLNDHWPDMRSHGFLSNRLFDVAACGAPLVSDPVQGLASVFGDDVQTYVTVEDLQKIVRDRLAAPEAWTERLQALSARIRAEHTFASRTAVMLAAAETALSQKDQALAI